MRRERCALSGEHACSPAAAATWRAVVSGDVGCSRARSVCSSVIVRAHTAGENAAADDGHVNSGLAAVEGWSGRRADAGSGVNL